MADLYRGDTNKYSVWVSTGPYNPNGNTFMHVCSDATFRYKISYGGNVTGILGQATSSAIFVDTSGGAVGDFSISGNRLNPPTSTDANAMSNKEFHEKMKLLLEAPQGITPFRGGQMLQNAYIIRLYRSDVSSTSDFTKYKDIPVFIKEYDMSYDFSSPNLAKISISGYKRNLGAGFGGA